MGMEYPNNNGMVSAAKGLAVLVVICLLRYFDTFAVIFSFNQVGIVPSIVAILVLLSGVLATVGLIRGQMWGFIPLYFFIPAVTLFFKFSLIPFLPSLVEPEYRRIAIVALNSIVLVYAVLLLLRMMDSEVIVHTEKPHAKGW
ncbi:hypothetical protein C942_01797 [Photobacterium marinum]|uniref:Integral membrane protein n=2 Tax=Photobacterium marinum TaxID=1056511 RepID=L8J8N2_9GAMM|nr:hypothetical protein C942_01797 [Photobacterium marinum]